MDFYPSNIMWRQASDGTIDLKVIDWDAAHLIDEPFGDTVRERLANTHRLKLCPPDASLRALPNVDSVLLDVLKANQADFRLQSDRKDELDSTFRELCLKYQTRPPTPPTLVAKEPPPASDLAVNAISDSLRGL